MNFNEAVEKIREWLIADGRASLIPTAIGCLKAAAAAEA